eukprot:TCONS_00025364-protein
MSNNREKWLAYNKNVAKRKKGEDTKNGKKAQKLSSIIVHRMKPIPEGKLLKFEPQQPRDFINFSNYQGLTLKNVKLACEQFYGEQPGSCDVLFSKEGPSCDLDEQIVGKKVILIRFIQPSAVTTKITSQNLPSKNISSSVAGSSKSSNISKRRRVSNSKMNIQQKTANPSQQFPRSISIGDVLKAGKLHQPEEKKSELEYFDIPSRIWVKENKTLAIKLEKFAEGAFREAFMAYANDGGKHSLYVVKKFKESSWEKVGKVYQMSLEQHTRKQIQMHMGAQAIANRYFKKLSLQNNRDEWFSYNDAYYSVLDGLPVTVEPYVPGKFIKYINNDGEIGKSKVNKLFYDKAEALAHFSYQESDEKLMLLDIQGSGLTLYDPEIATADEFVDTKGERFFCGGNLNGEAMDLFLHNHRCNIYCKLVSLEEVILESSAKSSGKEEE